MMQKRTPMKATKLDADKRGQELLPRRRRKRFALALHAEHDRTVGVDQRFSASKTAFWSHLHE